MKKLILIISSFALFTSCGNEQIENENVPLNSYNKGKELMELNCNSCHSSSAGENDRIAPPMIAIKKHYLEKGISKEDFIVSIQKWIKNPSEDISKMPNAVKKFGVMAKIDYPEETIKEIADYLYSNDIEKPEWFDDHYNQERGNGKGIGNGKGKQKHRKAANLEKLPYNERGLKYALSTKAVLGKNLMGKIQKEGTIAALKFCNEKAYPLTDSMSVFHKATIKRVSDKPRNFKNKANSLEEGYIEIFKENSKQNKESETIVVETNKNVKVYYPIKTNSMCLQCHGSTSSDIKANTLSKINTLYPKDLATGYSENQVRGIWSITFNKK